MNQMIVDFGLINSKMAIVYEDFSIWLTDITTNDILKIFNV